MRDQDGIPVVGWQTSGDLWTVCLECAPDRRTARVAWGAGPDDEDVLVAAVPLDQAVFYELTCAVCGRRLDRGHTAA